MSPDNLLPAEKNGKKQKGGGRLTPSKHKALAALLTCPTKKAAAEKIGITEKSLHNYFKDSEFVEAYNQAFAGVVQDATRAAQQTLQPALSTLKEIMEDADIAPAVRVQACRTALEYAIRLTDQNDLAERLAALERAGS